MLNYSHSASINVASLFRARPPPQPAPPTTVFFSSCKWSEHNTTRHSATSKVVQSDTPIYVIFRVAFYSCTSLACSHHHRILAVLRIEFNIFQAIARRRSSLVCARQQLHTGEADVMRFGVRKYRTTLGCCCFSLSLLLPLTHCSSEGEREKLEKLKQKAKYVCCSMLSVIIIFYFPFLLLSSLPPPSTSLNLRQNNEITESSCCSLSRIVNARTRE